MRAKSQDVISGAFFLAFGIVLFLMDRPFPVRLGRGKMKKKYERLAKVLQLMYKRKEFNKVAYIQINYTEDKVLVGSKRG